MREGVPRSNPVKETRSQAKETDPKLDPRGQLVRWTLEGRHRRQSSGGTGGRSASQGNGQNGVRPQATIGDEPGATGQGESGPDPQQRGQTGWSVGAHTETREKWWSSRACTPLPCPLRGPSGASDPRPKASRTRQARSRESPGLMSPDGRTPSRALEKSGP